MTALPPRLTAMSQRQPVTFAELRPTEVVDLATMLRILRRVLGLALRYPGSIIVATIATLSTAGISLLLPRLLGAAVDHAHSRLGRGLSFRAAAAELGGSAAIILAVAVLRGVSRMVAGYQG